VTAEERDRRRQALLRDAVVEIVSVEDQAA
jgi:hypothetical protein